MHCQLIGRAVTSMTAEAWEITDFRCFTKLKCDRWVQGQVVDKHSLGSKMVLCTREEKYKEIHSLTLIVTLHTVYETGEETGSQKP